MTKSTGGVPGRYECAYPEQEIGPREFAYCRASVMPGRSYCEKHMKVMYVQSSRSTLLKGSRKKAP